MKRGSELQDSFGDSQVKWKRNPARLFRGIAIGNIYRERKCDERESEREREREREGLTACVTFRSLGCRKAEREPAYKRESACVERVGKVCGAITPIVTRGGFSRRPANKIVTDGSALYLNTTCACPRLRAVNNATKRRGREWEGERK